MREDTPSSGSRRVTVLDYIVEQMSPDTLQAIARGVVTFYAVGEQLSKRMVHHVQKIHRIESGNDSVDGGAGNDTISIGISDFTTTRNAAHDVTVDKFVLVDSAAGAMPFDFSAVTGFASVFDGSGVGSSAHVMSIIGGDYDAGTTVTGSGDTLTGGNGADSIEGGAGNDNIAGDGGADTINGGAGIASIVGGQTGDLMHGDAGDESIEGGAGNESIEGDAGNDFLTGGDAKDTLYGGAGKDTLEGRSGLDELHGGAGDESILGGSANAVMFGEDSGGGGRGNAYLSAYNGHDSIVGGAGDETILGGAGKESIYGG